MAESRDWSEEFNVLVDECSLPFKGRVKEGFNVLHARAKSKLENSQTGPKFLKVGSRMVSCNMYRVANQFSFSFIWS